MRRRATVPRERRGVPRVPERLKCVRAVAPVKHDARLQRQHSHQTAEHAGRRCGRGDGRRRRTAGRRERGAGDAGPLALRVRRGVLLASAAGGAAARAGPLVRRGVRARETLQRAAQLREGLGSRVPPTGAPPHILPLPLPRNSYTGARFSLELLVRDRMQMLY